MSASAIRRQLAGKWNGSGTDHHGNRTGRHRRSRGAGTRRAGGEPVGRLRGWRWPALDSRGVGRPVNTNGFSVDLAELEVFARKAEDLSETLRTAWRQDRFDDDKWPASDPLRLAVITYRNSLRAAMERLSTGADSVAGHLRATAEEYQNNDLRATQRASDSLS